MASIFQRGFQREAWKPVMGQAAATPGTGTDWTGGITKVLTEGVDTYQSYAQQQTAEAQADAAKAQAEAEKAKTAAAQAAAAAAAAGQEKKIFGVPASYLLIGALGLGLLGVVVVLSKKN